MSHQLSLQQEIVLLALRDKEGTFSSGMYLYGIAGAMISELLLLERIAAAPDKKQTVSVLDTASTGDELLDELLEKIVADEKPRPLSWWVSKAVGMKDLGHRIAAQLCEQGILERDEKKVLWLFTRRVYPELDGSVEDAIRDRMARVMFHGEVEPDARTAVLIALASHATLLTPNFAPEELRQHKDRISQIADGDILAAGATQATIQAVQAAVMAAAIIPAMVAATSIH